MSNIPLAGLCNAINSAMLIKSLGECRSVSRMPTPQGQQQVYTADLHLDVSKLCVTLYVASEEIAQILRSAGAEIVTISRVLIDDNARRGKGVEYRDLLVANFLLKHDAQRATSGAALKNWKLVPVEPTESMIVQGFEVWPDESFSEPAVWEAYCAMSGCQKAAYRAKLCWAAMLAAAPTAESTLTDDEIINIANERHAAMRPDVDDQEEMLAIVHDCFEAISAKEPM